MHTILGGGDVRFNYKVGSICNQNTGNDLEILNTSHGTKHIQHKLFKSAVTLLNQTKRVS